MVYRNVSVALCAILLCFGAVSGCVTPGTKTKVTAGQEGLTIAQAQAEPYNGPKARIAIARFTDKTGKGWWTGKIGDGMADQLATALFNTNRFIVLERQILEDVLEEQDLGASGRIRRDTAAQLGQIEGAELFVVGAVTEFEGAASGGGGGAGLAHLGGKAALLGALLGAFKRAHMAIDFRLVDTRTSRIVCATSIEGTATDVSLGGLVGGYFGDAGLGSALAMWEKTPTEKALRICIKKAVDFVISKTPQNYYRHGSSPGHGSHSGAGSSQAVIVKCRSLNVRSGPGTNHNVLFGVSQGDRLSVIERSGKWIKIRTTSGQEGWTAGWLTTSAD
ncbi:MAG: CsgG/HfaB family protein [Pseudomonadota bacterium]